MRLFGILLLALFSLALPLFAPVLLTVAAVLAYRAVRDFRKAKHAQRWLEEEAQIVAIGKALRS